jgi:hypothetical protein
MQILGPKGDRMFRSTTVLMLLCTPFVVLTANASAIFEWPSNGHWYETDYVARSWTDANAAAVADGGYLASITSQAESDFLGAAFLSGGADHTAYWIGLSAPYIKWTSGEPVSWTNFDSGEPNDMNGIEHYIVANWSNAHGFSGTTMQWNDAPNTGCGVSTPGTCQPEPYWSIVEFQVDPSTGVPEPASLFLIGSGLLLAAAFRRRRGQS